MTNFDFIFKPGLWIGEGKVTFNASPEIIRFYTKWDVGEEKNQQIICRQHVEMEEGESNVYNIYIFSNLLPHSFSVGLESELLGKAQGKGLLDDKIIAWEFRGHPEFEGFEVYELQDNGDFMLHAEYSSIEQIRTIIDGRIWKKESK